MLLALCACTSQPAKDTTSEQTTADASSNSDIAQVKGELADYPEVYGSADTLRGKKFLLPMGTAAQILADV